jgi:hypothetical protein
MSKPHPIYVLAEEESAMFAAKLLSTPVAGELFANYLRAQGTMAAYKDVEAPEAPPSESRRVFAAPPAATEVVPTDNPHIFRLRSKPSEAAQVVAAAEKHLAKINQRQTSREIAIALVNDGIVIGGPDLATHAGRVSAHLSASTKFNNDRANGGYGLASWRIGQKMGPTTYK